MKIRSKIYSLVDKMDVVKEMFDVTKFMVN
jgi:hypothetical protein